MIDERPHHQTRDTSEETRPNMNTSALPNDLIMKIIRMADGGLNTHKKKFSESLFVIKKAGYEATRYTQRHVEEEEWDWGDLRILNVLTDENYNFDEWEYAFMEWIDNLQ